MKICHLKIQNLEPNKKNIFFILPIFLDLLLLKFLKCTTILSIGLNTNIEANIILVPNTDCENKKQFDLRRSKHNGPMSMQAENFQKFSLNLIRTNYQRLHNSNYFKKGAVWQAIVASHHPPSDQIMLSNLETNKNANLSARTEARLSFE
ncbi:hypothetical protein BpHYR1_036757 [Brachionus plicatilis]|uniref:Uncharacterized protein n=1 Tax=Brachionus plicatilis TaxID=10195 RepID=A0A3M7QL72_BRAPC|nr:hypothetical protein BpHYR1_036757 [Brachionus plicatilis]